MKNKTHKQTTQVKEEILYKRLSSILWHTAIKLEMTQSEIKEAILRLFEEPIGIIEQTKKKKVGRGRPKGSKNKETTSNG